MQARHFTSLVPNFAWNKNMKNQMEPYVFTQPLLTIALMDFFEVR